MMDTQFAATAASHKTPASVKYLSAGLCAFLLTACATGGTSDGQKLTDEDYRDAIGVSTNQAVDTSMMDPIAAAAYWGTRYDREPRDTEIAAEYSATLRKIGSVSEAVSVSTTAAEQDRENTAIRLEAGKALVESGRAFEAVRYLEEAAIETPGDWRALSAYGVALDQIGEHQLARVKYDQALAISPRSTTVLNNKGLSYALSGDLGIAARTLRAAASGRGGDARVRQNLALVLALKGDMAEAERLARSDLPPMLADQNIAYFRSLMNQPAYWQEIAADNVVTPNFDPIAVPIEPEAPEAAPSVKPQPLPQLREEPKPLEKEKKGGPVALIEAAPVTNASVEVFEEQTDDNGDAEIVVEGGSVEALDDKASSEEEVFDGVNLKD